ncbi:MAG TPA: hypothetical protein VNI52_05100 [Sphingobacteriaceae bacterium]|nr:hypothetical protein [Sphingobacteriaceae bacterium]
MKKIQTYVLLLALLISFSSCATIFGGRVSDYQRTKPADGEPSRKVRAVPLIADILLFWPGAIVDFATGAIYKPDTKVATTEPKK